ncbi:MAG: hypothetical protein Q7S57_05210 [bacterium]|nr:hypothetical protein [bacterium]
MVDRSIYFVDVYFVSMELIMSVGGLVVGVVGIVLAWISDRKRTQVETYIQASADAISSSLNRIKQCSDWAKFHFDKLLPMVLKIQDEGEREKAAIHAKDGRADATAIGDAHDIIQDQLSVLRTKGKNAKTK